MTIWWSLPDKLTHIYIHHWSPVAGNLWYGPSAKHATIKQDKSISSSSRDYSQVSKRTYTERFCLFFFVFTKIEFPGTISALVIEMFILKKKKLNIKTQQLLIVKKQYSNFRFYLEMTSIYLF